MHKFLLAMVTISLGWLPFNLSAQEICGTDIYLQQQIAEDPTILQQVEAIWQMDGLPQSASSHRSSPYIIPVVFHVVHDNGTGNIPYEQIESAIEVLNEDFSRTNDDTSSTRALFKSYAADSEIEFRLARVDPDGNCTNGVVRINNAEYTYDARNNVKSISYWPSNQYLNVWLVNTIENTSGSSGIILGFAQFPGSGSWSTYGIVARHDRIGKYGIGTSVSDGRTLTHEVGHCLNLLHTFQSSCGSDCSSSGDRVCDTPPSYEATYYCNTSQNTCSNDATGSSSVFGSDVVDQIENYMSYDDCQNMFSLGQKSRMHNVLENISQLVNLVSTSNLIATGVYEPEDVLCKADFDVESQIVCVGQPVTFNDLSYFNPTEYDWEFEGGYPETSSVQNPTVVYTEAGNYSVKLTIGDGTDTVITERTAYITVLPYPGDEAPLEESFEFTSGELESNNWFTSYQSDEDYGWYFNYSESYTGSASVKMSQYGYDDGEADLMSPAYSLGNMSKATVTFKTAYAQRTSSDNDILRVYASADCGETWTLRYVSGGSVMSSVSNTSGQISNLSQSDWMEHSFNLENYFMTEETRLKFNMTTDGGNDLYLDDINITATLDSVPVLILPLDSSSSSATLTTLDWKSTAITNYYELQVDVDTSFNTSSLITVQKNYISSSSNDTDTQHDLTNLITNQVYYWRVRGVLNGNTTDWSEVWSFTADTSSPQTGIEAIENKLNIALYPNPTTGTVNVVTNQTGTANIRVYNTLGQLIYSQESYIVSGTPMQIDLSDMANGWYIIETDQNQLIKREKIVIQHK